MHDMATLSGRGLIPFSCHVVAGPKNPLLDPFNDMTINPQFSGSDTSTLTSPFAVIRERDRQDRIYCIHLPSSFLLHFDDPDASDAVNASDDLDDEMSDPSL